MLKTERVWGMFPQAEMIAFKNKTEDFDDFLATIVDVLKKALRDTGRLHYEIKDILSNGEMRPIKYLSLKNGDKLEKLAANALCRQGYLKKIRKEKMGYHITEKGRIIYYLNFKSEKSAD